MILGLAIYNAILLELHFPTVVYKKLLGMRGDFEDLRELDPPLWHGLDQMRKMEGDVESLGVTFSVETEVYGELKKYLLKVT